MTAEVGQEGFAEYQANLSGGQPSTAANPLPVGVVSGELLGAATLTLETMAATISNPCNHAAYIEFGTSKMVARKPLWDAVQKMEGLVPTAQQKAVQMVFGG